MSDPTIITTMASEKVAFVDFEGLNEKVREAFIDDGWDDFEYGPVIAFDKGKLLFRGYDDSGEPDDFADVRDTWQIETSQLVADHLASGRILLRMVWAGEDIRYHLITPGKAEEVSVEKLLGFA